MRAALCFVSLLFDVTPLSNVSVSRTAHLQQDVTSATYTGQDKSLEPAKVVSLEPKKHAM
jgi:hypothetical protein